MGEITTDFPIGKLGLRDARRIRRYDIEWRTTVTTYALAAVIALYALLLAAVICFPWLIAVGMLVGLRLGPASATEAGPDGWDYDQALAATVSLGMPQTLARWLRRPGRPRYGRRSRGTAGERM